MTVARRLVAEFLDAYGVSHDVVALGYFDLLALVLEPGDSSAYGIANIYLRAAGGGSFTPVNAQEVKLYIAEDTFDSNGVLVSTRVVRRLFGGHVCDLEFEDDGGEKVTAVVCRDYGEEMDSLQLEVSRGTPLADTTFEGCIADIVAKMQSTGGVAALQIDGISDVAALTPGELYPHYTWKQFTSLRKILQDICDWAQARNPALRPRFTIGMTTSGNTFGPPSVHVWDAAAAPAPRYRFSMRQADINAGTHKPVFGPYKRKLDGTQRSTRIVALGADGLYSVVEDTAAKDRYPNRYSPTNSWMQPPVSDSSLATQADVDNLAKKALGARAYSRESVVYATYEELMPGDYVSLTDDESGLLDVVYQVASVRIVPDGTLKWRTEFTLGARLLELGDEDSGALAPPVEEDRLPPDPPTALTLTDNRYNPVTNLADLTFAWTPSTAGDVEEYQLRLFYPNNLSGNAYRYRSEGPTITISMPALTSFSARVRALDYHGNASSNSNTVEGVSAAALTAELYNPSFDLLEEADVTLPDGWTRQVSGTAAVIAFAGFLDGPYSLVMTSTVGEVAAITSTKFAVRAGLSYELNFLEQIDPFSNYVVTLRFFDISLNYLSGQDSVTTFAGDATRLVKSVIFTTPLQAAAAELVFSQEALASPFSYAVLLLDKCVLHQIADTANEVAGALTAAGKKALDAMAVYGILEPLSTGNPSPEVVFDDNGDVVSVSLSS